MLNFYSFSSRFPVSYAPEVTLKAFEAGGGQGYLDIENC